MKSAVKSATVILTLVGMIPLVNYYGVRPTHASQKQEVTIKFAAQVGDRAFNCGENYKLGKPATTFTPLDFRFYISDISLIDSNNKSIPLELNQDGKWQYQNVALIDFENKTGACGNGTTETRDIVVGKVPPGKYKGIKFTLGVPENLNHEDATLAPSPLNLTSLWWNWQFGYKFARIDFSRVQSYQHHPSHQSKHGQKDSGNAFFIHLGSTGCQAETSSQKPTTKCMYPNTATIRLTNFDPNKNIIVADVAKLVENTNLTRNQANTAPGCMSEPNDKDCTGIMASFGIPFGIRKQTLEYRFDSKQTFFRVK